MGNLSFRNVYFPYFNRMSLEQILKMALVTTGHVAPPEKAYIELQNANANIDLVSTQSRSINDLASQFSTICDIECAYSPQNTNFINVLTGEGIVSDIHGSGDHTPTHGSQALVSNSVSASSIFNIWTPRFKIYQKIFMCKSY